MKWAITAAKAWIRTGLKVALRFYLALGPHRAFSPDAVNRILVFAYHGLGNFIMFTPALQLLRKRYPDARIDLQVGNNTGCEEVLAGAGLFDNIYDVPYTRGARAWLSRIRQIRRTRYDLTLNEFHSHSWPLAAMVALSGAPFRAGHVRSPGWTGRFSRYGYVYNIPVAMREDEHEIERYIDLAVAAGAAREPLEWARPSIYVSEEDRTFAREYLRKAAIPTASRILGVQPGTSANMRWKQWPLDRFRTLLEEVLIRFPDVHVILFGTAFEAHMSETLARDLGSRVTLAAGKTTVKQVAALIETCDALLCNDSGLMHMAVAVGTPVVAIYGPTDIRRTRPLGERNLVIRRDLSCSPCFRLEGEDKIHSCPHHDCLMTIEPEQVFPEISRILDRTKTEAAGTSGSGRTHARSG